MKKLKVLHILLSLEIGGMEQVVADLTTHLNVEEFSTIVACLESLGPLATELEKQGVSVVQVDKMIPALSFVYPRKLMQVIRDLHIDVVHVHSGCWHKAALAARLCGVRNVIYTEHGRIFPDSMAVIFLDWLYAPLTRHVVTVSDSLAKYMRSTVGIRKNKISTIYNGIDVDRFQFARCVYPKDNILRIGIIARLAPVKDISTLVRAMVILRENNANMVLSIVGDGSERNFLESLVEELGLKNVVKFFGFRRDIPSMLQEIDIFVLCSLSEGTSITLLEAMASGKPVVVTEVGGNPAIVEQGVNGFLVPPSDPHSLAQALLVLAGDPVLRQNMAEVNSRKVMECYSIQAMVRSYEALYREGVC